MIDDDTPESQNRAIERTISHVFTGALVDLDRHVADLALEIQHLAGRIQAIEDHLKSTRRAAPMVVPPDPLKQIVVAPQQPTVPPSMENHTRAVT